jgi:hypothetical protein
VELFANGFSIVEVCGTVLVYGLAFCEDMDAILGKAGNRFASAGWKVRNAA